MPDVRVLVCLNVCGEATEAVVSKGNDVTQHARFPLATKLSRLSLLGDETIRSVTGLNDADLQTVAQEVVKEKLGSDWEVGAPIPMRSRYNKRTGDWDLIDTRSGHKVLGWDLKYTRKPVILGRCTDLKCRDGKTPSSLAMTPVIMVQHPVG